MPISEIAAKMSSSRRAQLKRIISSLLIASMLSACSKAVVIPREELSRNEYREVGDYRIKLQGWNEYHARRFSITDSTVVIEELKQSDDRYQMKKHDMPIVLPREQVEYIGEMKTNWFLTTVAILSIGAVVGFFVALNSTDWSMGQ